MNKYLIFGIEESFKNMDFWTLFSICFGISVIIAAVIITLVLYFVRLKRVKNHKIIIVMDGGVYQNSSNELIIKAKVGKEVDISSIKPYKEGYVFTGFNAYKKYVSSTITSNGITKQSITKEILDGIDKSIILMPNHDIYLVAKYTALFDANSLGLIKQTYYPSFLTYEDLISEIKHLNYNNQIFIEPINIYTSKVEDEFTYIYKNETLFMMIRNYKGLNKIYLRTNKNEKEILINDFFQIEDINDSYSWFSFIVMYNTNMSLFLNLVKDSYLDVDSSCPTSKTELKLIVSSINLLADPVLDRALLLTNKYLEDRENNVEIDYVKNRDLPILNNEQVNENGTTQVVDADGEVFTITDQLTEIEKEELNIKKTTLGFNKKTFTDFILENSNVKLDAKIRESTNLPTSLKYKNSTYFMVYQNRFGLVRVIVKLNKEYGDNLAQKHEKFVKSAFPITNDWYQFYLDDSFTSLDELIDIIKTCTNFNKSEA